MRWLCVVGISIVCARSLHKMVICSFAVLWSPGTIMNLQLGEMGVTCLLVQMFYFVCFILCFILVGFFFLNDGKMSVF